jgi:hypothetical protein
MQVEHHSPWTKWVGCGRKNKSAVDTMTVVKISAPRLPTASTRGSIAVALLRIKIAATLGTQDAARERVNRQSLVCGSGESCSVCRATQEFSARHAHLCDADHREAKRKPNDRDSTVFISDPAS